ncbi:MAG: response regulator [Chitinivibrionales bacterium]|nr:response regulator [Chitinivibrionales bacterium]
MNVLLVDDDDTILIVTKEMLADEGFDVATAKSFDDAVGVLDKGNIDIIISDLMMPGVSGVELLYKLRTYKIPIITMSGLSRDVVIDELLSELGIAGVLQKPFMDNELIQCIRNSGLGGEDQEELDTD